MSLGIAMFFKGLIVALWAVLVGKWEDFRKRRTERGLPLKQGRNGVYVVSDWTAKVNAAGRGIRYANYVLMVLIWIVVLALYFNADFRERAGLPPNQTTQTGEATDR